MEEIEGKYEGKTKRGRKRNECKRKDGRKIAK